jgi:RNA polymerase sigma factor (sigma-70 family)
MPGSQSRIAPAAHSNPVPSRRIKSAMMATMSLDDVSLATGAPRQGEADAEASLVAAAASGDAGAFERLYRMHVGRVYGLCIRLVNGDRAKAEQYAQDAFVRAWENLAGFRGGSRFSTWLHRLTVNVVLGEHRLLRRWVSFEEISEDGATMLEEPVTSHPQAQVGDRMDLEKALARLPKGARAVLILHDVEGYRHDEIADLTGIAVGTSKAQLHRARKLMKEYLL